MSGEIDVLVVGGGGREHALVWKIAQSPRVRTVLCAPGNAGTARVAHRAGEQTAGEQRAGEQRAAVQNVDVAANDVPGLVRLAQREEVDLVVVGPEDPLVDGLADALRECGIRVFGPGRAGAQLEGSKIWSKELLQRNRIPTAAWRRFDRAGAAKTYLETCKEWPQVVKADGLAAGKGVAVCSDLREACSVVDGFMEERKLGDAGAQIVVEEFLEGEEVSVHALTDGQALLILESVVDHKQVGDGDTGPNTGGMGVVSPARGVTRRLMRQIEQRILLPTLHALRLEDVEFRGTLFVGLMITENGPRVLEYNVRFGDPETQALMRRLRGDLVPFLEATADGRLGELEAPEWDPRPVVGVVKASAGYPGPYEKGLAISGLDVAERLEEAVVFHAGTRLDGERVVTSGGRVICATALGADVDQARSRAYEAADHVRWDGAFCRRDIGAPRRARRIGAGVGGAPVERGVD